MSIKVLVWNVQGVGNKLSAIREIVRINRPSIMALVETHMSGVDADKICEKINFSGQLRVEAQGFSGGIWLFWKSEEISVTPYGNHSQHLTILISKNGETPWLFSAIYASPNSALRKDLWRELERIKDSFSGPWMMAGDFNDTVSLSERNGNGGSEMLRRCNEFSNWIENNRFIDMGCSGPDHTWFRGNSPDTFKSARLDSRGGNSGFPPIPIATKPFRFQAVWLHHDAFENFVIENWKNDVPIVQFLVEFAGKLSAWNRDIFHNIFRKKEELLARLAGTQRELAKGNYPHLIKMDINLRKQLEEVLDQEETIWFQKSRMDAICDGDRNTKYFHLSTIIRRRCNRIDTLQNAAGEWITELNAVKSLVVDYWKSLFQEEQREFIGHRLLQDGFPSIGEYDWSVLTRPCAECEIKKALMSMKAFKAPGPDGFQPLFYQKYWEVVKPSVTRLITDILDEKDFPEGLNV
ncbi:uncharacterized protein LOC110689485 [Chenopodium quinoa]|uniref:uncharacterized protein LOC110689485 n=1 Tax=Chenopodium quinoa TaxID=63459 RepID=UPI000B78E92F|nr:uncharacterized protein LOC110689485 [Chenopodium quinoa]